MIKAIETRYKGYRFRSRLEARWAVFFDALGLKWEYEPEGFHLSNGERYLPDFKVTSPQGLITWYEVKPVDSGDDSKLNQFAKDHRKLCKDEFEETQYTLLSGDPVQYLGFNYDENVCPRCGNINNTASLDSYQSYANTLKMELRYFECWPCDVGTPGGGDQPIEQGITTLCRPHKGNIHITGVSIDEHQSKVAYAMIKARSARFEHGEKG